MKITSDVKKILIVGSGVVGLASGLGLLSKGFDVEFIDTNTSRLKQLKKRRLAAFTPNRIKRSLVDCQIIFISVPTPTKEGEIYLDFVKQAAIDVGEHLRLNSGYHTIVVRSTVVPGTTEDVIIPILERVSGKKVGKDFGVCMNPEYLREKSAEEDFKNPWVIVIGEYDKKSGDQLYEIYKKFNTPIHRITIKEAEIQKYIHNLFNATKISFFNEFRQICKQLGLNSNSVFELVAKSAEGILNPKYGIKDLGHFDGSCLPKDTQAYLSWAQDQGFSIPLLEATIKMNKELQKHDGRSREKYSPIKLVAETP